MISFHINGFQSVVQTRNFSPQVQHQPMANSSEDSSGVPQFRQITAEQSPHINGSVTSFAHTGQYIVAGDGLT
jgi:hypothetical protein